MARRALGFNGVDGVAAAIAAAAFAALVAPSPFADQFALPPRLVAASLDAGVLALTFDVPLAAPGEGWLDSLDITHDGVPVAPYAGTVSGGVELLVALPGGAHAGDVLAVRIREQAPLTGLNGLAVVPGPPVVADVATPREGLPTPRHGIEAVLLDGFVYTFGGLTQYGPPGGVADLDQIVRYDPSTGEAAVLPARLPVPAWRHTVVADPRPTQECPRGCAYVFGGEAHAFPSRWGSDLSGARELHTILRFEPVSGAVVPMRATLTEDPTRDLAGVFAGDAIYLFGGTWGRDPVLEDDYSTVISRYDPVRDVFETLPTRLPAGVWYAGAAHDPRPTPGCPSGCVYVLGGWWSGPLQRNPTESRLWDAVRFDPVSRTATPILAGVPVQEPLISPAVWSGDAAWLTGCCVDGNPVLLRFDPAASAFTAHPAPGIAFANPGLAALGDELLVLGGHAFEVFSLRIHRVPLPR